MEDSGIKNQENIDKMIKFKAQYVKFSPKRDLDKILKDLIKVKNVE